MACGKDIGGSEEVRKPVKVAFIIPPCPLSNDDGLRAISLNDFFKLVGHRIQGLIPRDPFPPFRRLPHGMENPIRMVCELRDG